MSAESDEEKSGQGNTLLMRMQIETKFPWTSRIQSRQIAHEK
jgi:hypothetical protein